MSWRNVIEGTVTGMGYELVQAELTAGGLLRVFIDRTAGDPRGEYIVVEDCESVTRQLQHVLEVENCAYRRLEVSSPGLDRPLIKIADYLRFAGQRVDLTLKAPFKGRKKFSGMLLVRPGGEPGGWRLLLDPAPAAAEVDQVLDFEFEEVREARLVPVLDFKGRRFLPEASAAAGVDGGS